MKLFVCALLLSSSLWGAVIDLSKHECKRYSQNGEDGILEKIFECIGASSSSYVEIGTESGVECNTRNLREKGWKGLLLDAQYEDLKIGLHQEFITAENIVGLFEKYQVPQEFDLLSIDIDFNDFYVWHAIAGRYKPRVVVIEYNAVHLPSEDKVVIYNPNGCWDGTNYFGASILSLYRLGKKLGYWLVYADERGVNLFFVRNDVLSSLEKTGDQFKDVGDVESIYRAPKYGRGPNGGHLLDMKCRAFASSQDFLSNH